MEMKSMAGEIRSTDTPLEVGDLIEWEELWGKEQVWAQIIEIDEGFCTTHFRVRFEDPELEKINQADKEWFRCKHLSDAVVYLCLAHAKQFLT